MPIRIQCTCGKQAQVRDEMAGKAVKCPGCGKPVRVAAAGATPPAAASAGRAAPSSRTAAGGQTSPPQGKRPAPGNAGGRESLDDLFAEEGFDREIAAVCPACGKEMAAGAVLCTKCGFNKQTGQRLASHQVAGTDIGMGTLALQKAQQDIHADEDLQKKLLGTGMPIWMLGLILLLIAGGAGIAVVAINRANQEEAADFNATKTFVQFAASMFAGVAIGALLAVIPKAFKVSKNEGLICLTILAIPVFVVRYFKLTWRQALATVFCGGIAAGLFVWSSTM